ncbi:hypothetical protein Tco_1058875 [Tanacetum coccineum]
MNDRGEIGFRLGNIEAEDNYMSMGVGIAEPSVEANTEPKATKKGSKRKVAAVSEEISLRIYHKNTGRSERIFNQKMKKYEVGPNGKGQTQRKHSL